MFFCSSCSKILKYSPTESAKVYDKAVNRKANVHFNPRQTLDYLTNSLSNADLTYDVKRRVVRQYLDVNILICLFCFVFCLMFSCS